MESGQFTPEMLEALRGDGDEEAEAKLAKLLDDLVQRLIEEGYLNLDAPPQMPGHQPVRAKGIAPRPRRATSSSTSPRRASTSSATRRCATSWARSASRASAATTRRTSRPASRRTAGASRTSSATCSTSTSTRRSRTRCARPGHRRAAGPRLRRPDGAPGRVPLVVRDGADARLLALDDPVRRGPLHAGEEGRARAHAPDPHAVPRRHAPVVLFHDSAEEIPLATLRARAGGPVPHEHGRGAQARAAHPAGAEEGHAADHHDHRRQAERADDAERADLQELDGARRHGDRADAAGGRDCRTCGDHDQHLHAQRLSGRPASGGLRSSSARSW